MTYVDPRRHTTFDALPVGAVFYAAPRKMQYAAMMKNIKVSATEYAYGEGNLKGARFPVKSLGRQDVWVEQAEEAA